MSLSNRTDEPPQARTKEKIFSEPQARLIPQGNGQKESGRAIRAEGQILMLYKMSPDHPAELGRPAHAL